MTFHFTPELFLESIELNRFQKFMKDDGFQKSLLQQTLSFGLIKQELADPNFMNGKVEKDINNTLQISELNAIDSQGQFITNSQVRNLAIPNNPGSWFWIKASYKVSTEEVGTVSVDESGNVIGVGTEFTKVLRGMSNFPSTIKFSNSVQNSLEYEVLEVISDTQCTIVHPAVSNGDASSLFTETNLKYQVVGTFTEGIQIASQEKMPFRYDSCNIGIVQETVANTKPTYTIGQEFYLARVRIQNGEMVIQDKRSDYFETKGAKRVLNIERAPNPLIGVEAIKWENAMNTGDRNIVQVAWGMRSSNWSINSSENIVTLASSMGGKYKTVNDFTDGDFNGWRLYTANGKYSRVLTSIKQGSAINLRVDSLEVDDYSNDGGDTLIVQEILVVPDCDSVEFKFSTNVEFNVDDIYTFPVNRPIGECLITVYADPSSQHNVQYRYKSLKEFTGWLPINSSAYYTELSFKDDGSFKADSDIKVDNYTSHPTEPFLTLILSPYAFSRFRSKVDKGDIIGVYTNTAFTPNQVIDLKVGISDWYQVITGGVTLQTDLTFSLSRTRAIKGNEFRIHLVGDINLNGYKISIYDDYTGAAMLIKEINMGDIYHMRNQDGGIQIYCVFDDLGKWIATQNYDLGVPAEIKMWDGNVVSNFDIATGLGNKKGLFGWKIHNVMQGRVPVGFGTITENYGNGAVDTVFNVGDTGGEAKHVLTVDESPKHRHFLVNGPDGSHDIGLNSSQDINTNVIAWSSQNDNGSHNYDLCHANGPGPNEANQGISSPIGGDKEHTNLQPYYVVAFIKKQY